MNLLVVMAASLLPVREAIAWGDMGHRIIGVIAYSRLSPEAREKVDAILAADRDQLTGADFVDRTTWADKYRDSDRSSDRVRYLATRQWHFVDIDIDGETPDIDLPCRGFPPLQAGKPASKGPADDCVVSKIEQFSKELSGLSSRTEKLLALKFLLHFVGDVHQPLHAAEHDHDRGGNDVLILFGRHRVTQDKLNLHSYWDTELVKSLGTSEQEVGSTLAVGITGSNAAAWKQGTPRDWAIESHKIAKATTYNLGRLQHRSMPIKRKDEDGNSVTTTADVIFLDGEYTKDATAVVKEQLQKAGVRLADILERSL
ncbi:S1/P1 nuclease [Uliginosibacterium sp. H3]|uniref:S1/P1 nuclease n=1 Tax=Uliginosibacterium silvisoli TaxID=3114758 RepID=A0ABU6K6Q1_9RHOO|nr:S1/P1 nuclease [Uliginosibacterium sp. H3]